MAESDLAAKISSVVFDAAIKASTATYAIDGANAVDSIADEAKCLVEEMVAENALLRARVVELEAALSSVLRTIDLGQPGTCGHPVITAMFNANHVEQARAALHDDVPQEGEDA